MNVGRALPRQAGWLLWLLWRGTLVLDIVWWDHGVTIVPSAGSPRKGHNATPLGQCRVLIIAPRSRVCEISELTMGCVHLVLGYSRIDFRFPQGSRNFLLSGVGFLFSVPFCYLELIWYLRCYREWR